KDEFFRIEFPPGTSVTDQIENKEYRAGEATDEKPKAVPKKDEKQPEENKKAEPPEARVVDPNVIFKPKEIDFGKIKINPDEMQTWLKKELPIHNKGKDAVFISKVLASCPLCMRNLSWKGGELAAGESRKITLDVFPPSWGLGVEDRSVYFELKGGREAEF